MADSDKGPLDGFYVEKNKILLIVLSVIPCTSGIMLILSLVCFFTAKTSEAKGLAKLLLIIAAVIFVVFFAIGFLSGGMALLMGRR